MEQTTATTMKARTTSFGVFVDTKTLDLGRDSQRRWHPTEQEFASGVEVVEFGETKSAELLDLFEPAGPHERTEVLRGVVPWSAV